MSWTHTGYPQLIRFGCGSVADAGRITQQLRMTKVMLVTTPGRRDSLAARRVIESLGDSLAVIFDDVRSHVPSTAVEAAVVLARQNNIDGLVSFGGGSCSDLGKAVCFAAEKHQGREPAASTHFDRPVLPHVSIPTAYSGAELTSIFGMKDEKTRKKSGAGGATITPAAVIYDPEATLDLPPRVSAETGMNALAHCVEAVWSTSRTPEAEAIALSGAGRIFRWLPRVVTASDDLDARSEMLAGAMLAGRCLQNASMGVHHGLAQMVGGRTGIPHGLANALILAHAVRFNSDAVPHAMRALSEAFGGVGDVSSAVDALRARLGLPARLRECGVTEEDIEAIAELSVSNPVIARNPKPVRSEDARSILRAAF